ncbi:MAG TPA: AAA family ATPase [Desulfobacterales bacterium]|nr:AAA family ATPase [Desulfobacterales bacterium]
MDAFRQFESICAAMSDPAFYPHPVSEIKRRDTHISSVFLTGKWVYKLKKPVDFGFLDFRDLNDRLRFCEQEIFLNQRLSQDVYHCVIQIYSDNKGGFSLKKGGPIAEYAVKMRQLPDAANMKELLKKNKIRKFHLKNLGQTLAAFYEKSIRNPHIDQFGHQDVIAFNTEENFQQLEPFVGDILNPKKWEFICRASRSFLGSQYPLFQRRMETGRIRDGHGDLRAEHVYFYRGIQVIDCIEFNDRFRYGDVAIDLAFLHMDMEQLGYPELSKTFLSNYATTANDPEIYLLIDFYAAYRAVVRLKVACLRSREVENGERKAVVDEAGRYLDLAYRYAVRFSRPVLWIFCGLPATGKSCLAERLAEALSIPVIQSDRIRKESLSQPREVIVPFGRGLYHPEARDQVYNRMVSRARDCLKEGRSAVLDATYAHCKWRDEVRTLAAELNIFLIFVECACSEETIRLRLSHRQGAGGLSDARLQHLPEMLKQFEPLEEIAPEMHLVIDTEQPLEDAFIEVLSKGYASKCAQAIKFF